MENLQQKFNELKSQANAYFKDKIFSSAINLLKECLKLEASPEELAAIYLNISNCYFNLHAIGHDKDGLKESEHYSNEAIKLNPKYFKAHWRKAKIYEKMRKFNEFIGSINHCLEI